ncbi:hypothetical protein SEA_SAMPSON_77 [Gordonia Phage Sampson]|uniref:Uncharacterized protein n=1 Tax=Gordonia Phage Sampson TaxID=2951393 RepID=A0A9E7NI41_9CAUD|nr:hypothetical protein SEA_SAMPSON_77 [Gordonia Phage Sampson]
MTRRELLDRILFAVDGYRFGEWTLDEAAARILKLIADAPAEAIHAAP